MYLRQLLLPLPSYIHFPGVHISWHICLCFLLISPFNSVVQFKHFFHTSPSSFGIQWFFLLKKQKYCHSCSMSIRVFCLVLLDLWFLPSHLLENRFCRLHGQWWQIVLNVLPLPPSTSHSFICSKFGIAVLVMFCSDKPEDWQEQQKKEKT